MAICRDLSSTDMASLAQCSHSHAALVQPHLYENITVFGGVLPRYMDSSSWKYSHSHLFALASTVLSRPSLFGPFVKSISLNNFRASSECDPGQIALFFEALTNLCHLRFWFSSYNPPGAEYISKILSGVSTSLVEFQTSHTPALPSMLEFVRSHPNVPVLHLGSVFLDRNVRDDSGRRGRFKYASPRAELPHLTALELEVMIGGLAFANELLASSTHIERLSITYSDPLLRRRDPSIPEHLHSFELCGAHLNHLIISNTPYESPQPFSWVLSNILPRTPNLRILELRETQRRGLDVLDEDAGQVIVVRGSGRIGGSSSTVLGMSGKSQSIATFPTKLERLIWVGADAGLPSNPNSNPVRSGLSLLGESNVHALFELFEELEVVEYHERGDFSVFRRGEGGAIGRSGGIL